MVELFSWSMKPENTDWFVQKGIRAREQDGFPIPVATDLPELLTIIFLQARIIRKKLLLQKKLWKPGMKNMQLSSATI